MHIRYIKAFSLGIWDELWSRTTLDVIVAGWIVIALDIVATEGRARKILLGSGNDEVLVIWVGLILAAILLVNGLFRTVQRLCDTAVKLLQLWRSREEYRKNG